MAITPPTDSPPIPAAVKSQLAALRGRIRRYIWLEGLAAMGVWLGLAFVVSWVLDWNFELPVPIRLAMLVITGVGLLVVAYYFILRRTFVRLSDSSMATLIERRFPALGDSLLTTVWLSTHSAFEAGYSPAMLEATRSVAQERISGVHLNDIFDPMPLVRKVTIAFGLIALMVGGYFLAPGMSSLWAKRNLLLADIHWPRKIMFEADEFKNGVVKVPSGSDFKLHVLALHGDTEVPVLPQNVEVRYRYDGGNRGRHSMDRIGALAAASGSKYDAKNVLQVYEYKFSGLLSSVHFDVVGGDGYLHDLCIQVVPNPSLSQVELEYNYPTYMERGPRREPVAGAMPVPIGAKIVVHARSNKPLEQVRIDCPGDDTRASWRKELEADAPAHPLGSDRSTLAFEFVPFPAAGKKAKDPAGKDASGKALSSASAAANASAAPRDLTLLFTLRDADGISNREPIPLALVAVPDEAPQVALRLAGIGTAITPSARLPVTGKISDDYGLDRAWWDYLVEGLPAAAGKKANSEANGVSRSKPSDKIAAEKPVGSGTKEGLSPESKTDIPRVVGNKKGSEPLIILPKHPAEVTMADSNLAPENASDNANTATKSPSSNSLEVSKLSLAPQQKLSLSVKASDLYDLGPNGPNIGASETWQLDVVTPDELRSLLQGRELVLRQRFESIVQEMTETRDILAHIDFAPPSDKPTDRKGDKPSDKKDEKAGGNKVAEKGKTNGLEKSAGKPADKNGIKAEAAGTKPPAGASKPVLQAGDEPGEEAVAPQKLTPAELLNRRTEQVLLALQNCHKNMEETAGVVEGIDDIRLQMVNNRIETEQVKRRLGENVSLPLHLVYDRMFPQFVKDLEDLQGVLANSAADPSVAAQRREIAREEADKMLLKMQEVLHNMLELENFQEVVERLKAIIQSQEELNIKTKKHHADALKDLKDLIE